MRTGSLMAWAVVATGVAAAGCGSSGYGSSGSPAPAPAQCTAATATALGNGTVTLMGMAFQPGCAKVAAGTTVTFANDDTVAHTVTADAGGFDQFVNPGRQVTQVFPTAGTVGIHCTIHAGMRMTLIVL
jgi:plastocyanin